MNTRRRLSKLSFSMPDVTGAGCSPSPGFYAPAQEMMEELEEEEETGENHRRRGSVLGPCREERWMDATNPTSGSVFYVDTAPWQRLQTNGSVIPPTTGSSSLSSSPTSLHSHPPLTTLPSSPLPHPNYPPSFFTTSLPPTPVRDAFCSPLFPPPRSVTPQYSHSVYPFSDKTSSTLPSPTRSESIDGLSASVSFAEGVLPELPSPPLSSPPSEGWIPKSHSTSSVGRSVKKGWKKIVRRSGGGKRDRKMNTHLQRMLPSDSVPNLTCDANYSPQHESEDVAMSLPPPFPPHGELYGSGRFPLTSSDSRANIISVRISLRPHPLAGRLHRHWNLEKLGIVPARALKGRRHRSFTNLNFTFKNHYPPDSTASSLSDSLVIRGIIPGSPASLTPNLQPGDTILAVNGRSVTLDKANSVVRSCSDDELVLIVKKKTHHSSTLTSTPAHHHLNTSSHHSNLARLVSGKQQSHCHQSHHPHLLLYLTLDTKEDDPVDKDILYCYPSTARGVGDGGEGEEGEESVTQLLVQLRGVFLTLSDVIASITAESKSCSTVQVLGQLFHLAHMQYGKEVLLLALPASLLPPHLLMATTQRVENTLRLLFGSLQRAFSSPENCSSVDHLLSLLLHHLSPPSQPHSSHLHTQSVSPITSLTAVPRGVFSTEAAVHASEALDMLEAVSPSHQLTDIAHSPRTLFPRGSFLFHKGQLFQSHLPPAELVDVVTFCQAYRLLELSQEPRLSMVIWREIHLQSSWQMSSESELGERVFLLLVGLDRVLVGLIMEGRGLTPETTPTLDPVYVSEAKQLIARLDVQDIFNTNTNSRALKTVIPAVVSLDRVITAHLSTPHISTPHQSPYHSSPRTRRLSLQPHAQGSDTDEEEEDTRHRLGPRALTLPSLRPRGKRKQQPHREPPSPLTSLAIRQNYTLTAGVENILLHYLCLEAGQGVWLSPTHNTSYGTLHSEMLECFQATCFAIRNILLTKTNAESEDSDDECDWGSEEEDNVTEEKPSPPTFSLPSPGGQCLEHGVMLEVPLKHFATEKQLKNMPPLFYWIVGRMFPESGRELYVCYEENMSQNMVELAFKLLFATSN